MKCRILLISLLIGIIITFSYQEVIAQQIADIFRFPVENYKVDGYYFGQPLSNDLVHVGEDCNLSPGTPVCAIANGEVKLSKKYDTHYGQVIAIEHILSNGEMVCSIYGHLSRKSGYPLISLGPVNIGDIIGYIGWHSDDPQEDENGDGKPHLHLGIRKGAYVGLIEGRAPNTNNFYNPSDFINQHSQPLPETADVGEFQYGSYPKITQAFIRCYNRHDVGIPFNNGYGPYVHDCGNSIWIQDYKRNDGGIRHILYNPIPPYGTNQTEAYMMFGGIAEYYFNHNGPYDFGVPFTDDLTVTYYGGQYGNRGEQKVIQKFHQRDNQDDRKVIGWDALRGTRRCHAGVYSYSDYPGATIYEWKNGQEEK